MEPTQPTTYSYGPFFPGNLPEPTESHQLQTVLRSNGRCAPADLSVDYGGQIAPTLAKVAEYDVEIAKVQAILKSMGGDRSVLQYHAEGCDSVSAPIRRLQNETLLEIFHLCSPLQDPSSEFDWIDYQPDDPLPKVHRAIPRYRYLLVLAQVCASWLNLIMDSPSLWAQIEVDYTSLVSRGYAGYGKVPKLADEMTAILREFLQRSRIAPLEIYLRSRNFGYVPYGPSLDLIAQQSNRWTQAKLWPEDSTKAVDDFAAFAPVRGNLAQLKSLHISNLPDDCNFFEIAPRLTELALEELVASHPRLPWGQLRTLSYPHLFAYDLQTAISHLSRCPQIEKLEILRLYVSEREDDPVILAPLVSDVQSLVFGFTVESWSTEESPMVTGLLGCFTLRRAHSLRFETTGEAPLFWPHVDFLLLCTRSALHDTLRTLDIHNLSISAVQLLECLSKLPRLESLSICDPFYGPSRLSVENIDLSKFLINDILLRGLTLAPDSEELVPRLHTLDCKTFMQFEDSSYLDFIASRVGPGRNARGPFQSSVVYFCDLEASSVLVEGLAGFVQRQELRSRLECDHLNSHWPREWRMT
ncbi:hypothetical protein C8R46DRAFT_1117926 [Mycena filopes]|nr:hypothetical protein C8R46DRAFT_1117926 [Mycena filopes]